MFCLQIQDSNGHILSQKEDIPYGKLLKFSFVTETYNTFEICFASHVPNRMYTWVFYLIYHAVSCCKINIDLIRLLDWTSCINVYI